MQKHIKVVTYRKGHHFSTTETKDLQRRGFPLLWGWPNKGWVEEEVALEPIVVLKVEVAVLYRTGLEGRDLLGEVEVEGKRDVMLVFWDLRSSGPSERKEFALCLKSSVKMNRLSKSMGEPLDSEYSIPKWRKWARA